MALRPTIILVPRTLRRPHRCGHRRCRTQLRRLRSVPVQGRHPGSGRPAHRRVQRLSVHEDRLRDHSPQRGGKDRSPSTVQVRADLLVLAGGARAWNERCAEDDGRHHPRARLRQPAGARHRPPYLGDHRMCSGDRAGHLCRRLAHHRHSRNEADDGQGRTGAVG